MTADLTDVEVAEALRKHPRTIQRWAQKGLLPGAYKAGRSWRIPQSALNSANLNPRSYTALLVSELRSARVAIDKTQTDLLGEQDSRLVRRELLALHDACIRLGRELQDSDRSLGPSRVSSVTSDSSGRPQSGPQSRPQ